jgi:excisionase family DNA binding protein
MPGAQKQIIERKRLMNFSELTKLELEKIIENANFTEEEMQIFKMLACGKSLEQISQKILLSKSTVSRRIVDIKNKIERTDNMNKTIPIWEKALLTVEETAEYSNIGLNKIRELLNQPGCTFAFFVGKGKCLVKRREFEKFIDKTREI